MLKKVVAALIIIATTIAVTAGFALGEAVVPCPVYAAARAEDFCYTDRRGAVRAGRLTPGERLEIIMDRGERWYFVRRDNDAFVWVKAESIDIPPDEPADTDALSEEYLEYYVRENGFDSQTDRLVFTEIFRQTTHVFRRADGVWRLERSLRCVTGKNSSPTTRGRFTITDRGSAFYSERLGSGARYWVRFNGTYLFHSVTLDRDGGVIDPAIGNRRTSSGCVRFSMNDALWFYDNVPDGTAVYVI